MGIYGKIYEAILLPGTDDNGFFDYFERVALQMPMVRNMGQYKACHNKQKSIIANSDNEMWVCHFLTDIRTMQDIEYVHHVDMRTGAIKPAGFNIPDTDVYKIAREELWSVMGIFFGIPTSVRKVERLENAVYSYSNGKFIYDDNYHDVRSYSLRRSATIPEIVDILGMELKR